MRSGAVLIIIVSLLFAALNTDPAYGQTVGKEGNRVAGVVVYDDGSTVPANGARVEMLGREETSADSTSADGVFCIAIPKEVKVFQVVARATGYWPAISTVLSSTRDPIKTDRLKLVKKNPKDKAQLGMIDVFLQTELIVYQHTASATVRRTMKAELIEFGESIEIPPPDQSMGMTMQEREMRIRARASIDAVVVRMK
jgi:hypothetical protein